MRRSVWIGAWLVAGAGVAAIGGGTGTLTAPASAEAISADAQAIREHLTFLASPFLRGRLPATKENDLAADFIIDHYMRLGLKPAFPETEKAADGTEVITKFASYRQFFEFGRERVVKTQRAEFGGAELAAGTDYNVLSFAGDGEASNVPLVFVGYGIANGPEGYNSFGDTENNEVKLEGKVAIVLRFEPVTAEGKSRWTEAGGWSPRSGLEAKIREVARRGAAGIVLVNPPGADDARVGKMEDLNSISARRATEVPVVMMSIDAADRVVRAADEQGRGLLDLRKLADEKGGVIELSKSPITLETDVDSRPIPTANVGAVLEGRGELKDQYLVIGAHFDHLGPGNFGSTDPSARGQIHYGADDNASGTSGMMLLASKFAAEYKRIAEESPGTALRSILFMGFCAEESGLNGSRHYAQNPIVPIDRHFLMINLDMIGRLRGGALELHGTGTAEGLGEYVKPFIDASGFKVAQRPGGLGPSDHASFYSAGVPVLFFFTGLHPDYHNPRDTIRTINFEGTAKVADLAYRMGLGLVQRTEPMPYSDRVQGRTEMVGRGGTDEPAAASPGAASPAATSPGAATPGATDPALGPVGGVRVRFGIMPGDYSGSEPGILVGGVTPGGSADKAGIKVNDRMIKWNGKALPDVESWMPLLSEHKPGDKVEIVLVRDGKEVTVTAELQARGGGN